MTSDDGKSRFLPPDGPGRGRDGAPAPYDAIALDYADMNVLFKQGVIGPSMRTVLGSLHGEAAIDWACGSGEFSTIPLVSVCHAEHVLGIDRSPEMIRQARLRSEEFPQIAFLVGDAVSMNVGSIEPVRIASGVFLLNYAEDSHELMSMYGTVARCLRKGGRFVAVVPNPLTADVDTPQYGMCARTERDPSGLTYDGAIRTATLFPAGREAFSFKTYWYSEATYMRMAAMAGLEINKIVAAAPSNAALRQFGADFFHAYQVPHPQHLILEFIKR